MRISDWSSDVCSSDLQFVTPVREVTLALRQVCSKTLETGSGGGSVGTKARYLAPQIRQLALPGRQVHPKALARGIGIRRARANLRKRASERAFARPCVVPLPRQDRKSTRLNSSH